jgi:hypothetical protein
MQATRRLKTVIALAVLTGNDSPSPVALSDGAAFTMTADHSSPWIASA